MSSLPRCLPKSSDIATIDSNGAATALNYRGPAKVVYGHIVNPRPEWVNNTINIHTGCGFGGRLTALRYPELELISVPARRAYVEWGVSLSLQTAIY